MLMEKTGIYDLKTNIRSGFQVEKRNGLPWSELWQMNHPFCLLMSQQDRLMQKMLMFLVTCFRK